MKPSGKTDKGTQSEGSAPKNLPDLTPEELETAKRLAKSMNSRKPRPKIKTKKLESGTNEIAIDHPKPEIGWALLMESLSTTDPSFIGLITRQLVDLTGRGGEPDDTACREALSVVQAIEPRDEVEALLATQMAAIHIATMRQARLLKGVENIPQQDSASNALNKLARTFTAQVEALKRYRTGGVQKVIVQHVQVNEGGQAIVAGEVTPGGGKSESEHQPYVRDEMRVPEGQAVLSQIKTDPLPMSSAFSEGLECMPVPRSKRRPTLRAVE